MAFDYDNEPDRDRLLSAVDCGMRLRMALQDVVRLMDAGTLPTTRGDCGLRFVRESDVELYRACRGRE